MEPSVTSYKSLTRNFLTQIVDLVVEAVPKSVRSSRSVSFTGKGSLMATFSTHEPAEPSHVDVQIFQNEDLEFFQIEVDIQRDRSSKSQGFSVTYDESLMTIASKVRSFLYDNLEIPGDGAETTSQVDLADVLEMMHTVDGLSNEVVRDFHSGSKESARETCRQGSEIFDRVRMLMG